MSAREVWIVEPIGYDRYGILGVYDSLEAAKASLPDEQWKATSDGWESIDVDACSNRGYSIYPEDVQTLVGTP